MRCVIQAGPGECPILTSRRPAASRLLRLLSISGLTLACALLPARAGWAAIVAPVSLTLLHTNDLHSHLRPEKSSLGLGGIARLKTAIDRLRSQATNSLLLDGGDWSEGNIYYTQGAGAATLQLMDHLGYDVAVVGNHDWLNGPDILVEAYRKSQTRMQLVGANLTLETYPRRDEFKKAVPPFVIRNIGGVKVAIIGLVTYEMIYDRFFTPVKISFPAGIAKDLSHRLKAIGLADVVIAISHNSVKQNAKMLEYAPELDFIVGAHDHKKLSQPLLVRRQNAPDAWVVEAGKWGEYLGRMELKLLPLAVARAQGVPVVRLEHYELVQMDASIPEDPETVARVDALDKAIEGQFGPIFHDHVADNEVEIDRDGPDPLMGDLATDAFRKRVGADIALHQVSMISNSLHPGELRSVDVFNAMPQVWDPTTQKTWTLKTFRMKGSTLKWLLSMMFSGKIMSGTEYFDSSIVSVSGLSFVLNGGPPINSDPALASPFQEFQDIASDEESRQMGLTEPQSEVSPVPTVSPPAAAPPALAPAPALLSATESSSEPSPGLTQLMDFKVNGLPLDPNMSYKVAASEGIMMCLEFINGLIPGAVKTAEMNDTGLEEWRVVRDYLREMSPVKASDVPAGNRIRSLSPDLGMYDSDVQVRILDSADAQSKSARVSVNVKVRNLGMTPSPAGPRLRVLGNLNGIDTTRDEVFAEIGKPLLIPALDPGQSFEASWTDVRAPGGLGRFPVTVRLTGNTSETIHGNDQVTSWGVLPGAP
jgi:5'-nucleotidase/UDP-sugar diphosphatase